MTCADVRDVMWQLACLDAARAEARFSREMAHLRTCASCYERFAAIALVAEEDAAGIYGPPAYEPGMKASIAADPIRLSLSGGAAVALLGGSTTSLELRLDRVSATIFARVSNSASTMCSISLRARDAANTRSTDTPIAHVTQQVQIGEWAPLSRIGAGRYELVIQFSPSGEPYAMTLDITA